MIYIGTVSFGQSDSRACLMGWQTGCTVSPYRTVCTIDKKDFNNFIKSAYINYKKINYDLCKAKEILIYYIKSYYKNNDFDLPNNPNDYKLNKINDMLKINIISNYDITFYVCMKTRQLYYV
jgi:hypothetical protein